MFIIICSQKKLPYGHGDAMVKCLIIQCEGEEFKTSNLQSRLDYSMWRWGVQDFKFAI
jgi:hypothetical protein